MIKIINDNLLELNHHPVRDHLSAVLHGPENIAVGGQLELSDILT